MRSMDCLESLGNPNTPTTTTTEQAPAEALQRLEQIQIELREQVTRAANDGDSFDSTERLVWEIVKRTGHAATELLLSLQGSGDCTCLPG